MIIRFFLQVDTLILDSLSSESSRGFFDLIPPFWRGVISASTVLTLLFFILRPFYQDFYDWAKKKLKGRPKEAQKVSEAGMALASELMPVVINFSQKLKKYARIRFSSNYLDWHQAIGMDIENIRTIPEATEIKRLRDASSPVLGEDVYNQLKELYTIRREIWEINKKANVPACNALSHWQAKKKNHPTYKDKDGTKKPTNDARLKEIQEEFNSTMEVLKGNSYQNRIDNCVEELREILNNLNK